MGILLAGVATSAITLSPVLAAPGAPAGASRLVLASWNIEHLARETGAGEVPRSTEDYARLREHAASLGADIVALQEVQGAGAARRLFDARAWDFHFAASEPRGQGLGFAWRQGLNVVPQPDVTALALKPGLRPGVDVLVEFGGRKVRLLAVHLKSGCQADALYQNRNEACGILREQLAIVERWMDARAAAGEPFVVMGDFNRSLRPHDPAWTDLDDGAPPESDLTDPAATESTRCWNAGWVDFIDHIVFSRTAARWIVPGSFRQVQYRSEDRKHRAKLSDHCAITVTIE